MAPSKAFWFIQNFTDGLERLGGAPSLDGYQPVTPLILAPLRDRFELLERALIMAYPVVNILFNFMDEKEHEISHLSVAKVQLAFEETRQKYTESDTNPRATYEIGYAHRVWEAVTAASNLCGNRGPVFAPPQLIRMILETRDICDEALKPNEHLKN